MIRMKRVRVRVESRRRISGFTLIELLVVIAVIGVLIGLLYPSVQRAIIKAKQAKCAEQLHQFGIATFRYKEDNNETFPPWLSALFPDYIDSKEIYLCPSDRSRGADGARPNDLPGEYPQFEETDDVASNTMTNRNPEITVCSYMYELSAAECTKWSIPDAVDLNGDGKISWYEMKIKQLNAGDGWHEGPYQATSFPIIRCFHHWQEDTIPFKNSNDGTTGEEPLTLNVSYVGNVFRAPMQWELKP